MSDLMTTYKKIFELIPETCKFVGVRHVVNSNNESGSEVNKFIGLIEVPVGLDDIYPSKSDCDYIRKKAMKFEGLGGSDVTNIITFELNGKARRYLYSVQLVPSNILYFEISDGIMRIECFCYGMFY